MPFYRAFFTSRQAAETARSGAALAIESLMLAQNAVSETVVDGSTPATAAPTAAFSLVDVAPLPAGAAPPGVTAYRCRYNVQTPDGRPAVVAITQATDPTAVAALAPQAFSAPLDWRTRLTKQADGRWAVDLYTFPPGT